MMSALDEVCAQPRMASWLSRSSPVDSILSHIIVDIFGHYVDRSLIDATLDDETPGLKVSSAQY